MSLRTCLSGSKKKIYDNIAREMKGKELTEEGAAEIYKAIKARLFQFLETPTEKQLRISTEWERLHKTKQMTA